MMKKIYLAETKSNTRIIKRAEEQQRTCLKIFNNGFKSVAYIPYSDTKEELLKILMKAKDERKFDFTGGQLKFNVVTAAVIDDLLKIETREHYILKMNIEPKRIISIESMMDNMNAIVKEARQNDYGRPRYEIIPSEDVKDLVKNEYLDSINWYDSRSELLYALQNKSILCFYDFKYKGDNSTEFYLVETEEWSDGEEGFRVITQAIAYKMSFSFVNMID